MSERTDVLPALIVGAGPAGLTAAIALARHGVGSLLVERRPALSGLPRATVISTRSMELFRSWGLEDEIRASGLDVEWRMWIGETLARVSTGSTLEVGLPTRQQSALVSPTVPACVSQDHLEPILLRHLRSLAVTEVRLGTAVDSVANGPDGIRAVLRDIATGRTRTVEARYLIGSDGAHSTVRSALGIPMRGPERLRDVVTALFRAPLWDVLGARRYGIYAVNHAGVEASFLPAGPGDRWLFGLQYEPGRHELAEFTEERLTSLIRLGSGVAALQPRIERIGGFSFAAQLADRFRDGAAFLIGDAAHRVTPRGGTGMNTAIHDGYDLGWKLAWVLRGWARPELLDSYEAERRPVAEHNVTRSADPHGSLRRVEQELHADIGGRIEHIWLHDHDEVSTLDLLGPGLTLFTGPASGRWATAAIGTGPVPVDARSLDGLTARALGIPRDGALLARPDGMPVALWSHDHDVRTSLRCAIETVVSGGPSDRGDPARAHAQHG